MSAQRWIPGRPWRDWAEASFPDGWLAVGGPKGGALLPAGRRTLEVVTPAEVPKARFWDLFEPLSMTRPDAPAFVRHTYRHERLSFPPALHWHVYVHETLTTEEAQTALFYRLLKDEAGVEDVRDRVGHG